MMREFVEAFESTYRTRRTEEETRMKRKLSSAHASSLRGQIRREMAAKYPKEVEAITHYYEVNYAQQLKTGKPQPSREEWPNGQKLESTLRGLSITQATERKDKVRAKQNAAVIKPAAAYTHSKYDPERIGKAQTRYNNLVKAHGIVPNDIIASSLMGVSHAKAVQLRRAVEENYTLEEMRSAELPHLVNNFWLATPKTTTTAALKEFVEDLSEADRQALIELLRSTKS